MNALGFVFRARVDPPNHLSTRRVSEVEPRKSIGLAKRLRLGERARGISLRFISDPRPAEKNPDLESSTAEAGQLLGR